MFPFRRLAMCVVAASLGYSASHAIAVPLTIFKDDFESDTAGTGNVAEDLDPLIGTGDIGGSWTIREGSSGNNFVSGAQVYNNADPENQSSAAGTNNYLRSYRAGSVVQSGNPYATGWNVVDTTDRVVQLDMSVWQQTAASPPTYLEIEFGGAPQTNPSQTAWQSTVSLKPELADGTGGSIDFPDGGWHSVKIIANYSLTTEQMGIAAQSYTVSIDSGTATTGSFATTQNTVRSILIGRSGLNEQFHFIDNVQLQILNPVLFGDYNSNGTVDAADYVLWRAGVTPLDKEVPGVTPGSTTDEDYAAWRARFGNSLPASSIVLGSSTAVPEPTVLALLAVIAGALCASRGAGYSRQETNRQRPREI